MKPDLSDSDSSGEIFLHKFTAWLDRMPAMSGSKTDRTSNPCPKIYGYGQPQKGVNILGSFGLEKLPGPWSGGDTADGSHFFANSQHGQDTRQDFRDGEAFESKNGDENNKGQ